MGREATVSNNVRFISKYVPIKLTSVYMCGNCCCCCCGGGGGGIITKVAGSALYLPVVDLLWIDPVVSELTDLRSSGSITLNGWEGRDGLT